LKIAITGKPGTGKTTLIKRIFSELSSRNVSVSGFYTEELREKGQRIGFDIVMLNKEVRLPLARKEMGKPRIGKYRVFIENIEKALKLIKPADLYIIDEVGKMELLSPSFKSYILNLLEEKNYIITYGLGIDENIRKSIEEKSRVFVLNSENREYLFNEILLRLNIG